MKQFILTLFLFLASTQTTLAEMTCTLNGEVVPCDDMPGWFWGLMAIPLFFVVVATIFWLWMLIDAIKYQQENKLMWVLVILFASFIGAVVYYFVAKQNRSDVYTGKKPGSHNMSI